MRDVRQKISLNVTSYLVFTYPGRNKDYYVVKAEWFKDETLVPFLLSGVFNNQQFRLTLNFKYIIMYFFKL